MVNERLHQQQLQLGRDLNACVATRARAWCVPRPKRATLRGLIRLLIFPAPLRGRELRNVLANYVRRRVEIARPTFVTFNVQHSQVHDGCINVYVCVCVRARRAY